MRDLLLCACVAWIIVSASPATPPKARKMVTLFHFNNVWPFNRAIPYYINTSLFTPLYTTEIEDSLAYIADKTCLKFNRTSSPPLGESFLNFVLGDGCNADVGYRSGQATLVRLSPVQCRYGSIVHEIGHTLGLLHTMQRPDADEHIYIDKSVLPEGVQQQFVWTPALSDGVVNTPYDYDSIMHYSRTAGSVPAGSISMYAGRAIGQLRGFSQLDLAEIDWMYGSCKEDVPRCLSPTPPMIKVSVNTSVTMLFYGNFNPSASTPKNLRLVHELPDNASINGTFGEYYFVPGTTIEVVFNATTAHLLSKGPIKVRVGFEFISTVSSPVGWCDIAIVVVPFQLPRLECFGYSSTSTTVCSGHGQCVAPDACKCVSGWYGTSCHKSSDVSEIGYQYLPLSPVDFVAQPFSATPSSGRKIQYNLNISDGAEFELTEIMFAFFCNQTTDVTYAFADSTGQVFLRKLNTHKFSAIPLTPQYVVLKAEIGAIPKVGSITLHTTAGTSLVSDSAGKAYVRLSGIVRCYDGWFGPSCSQQCPGGAGTNQCYGRGLCNDGPAGSGKCECKVPHYRAAEGCAFCEWGWRGSNCREKYSPTSTPTPRTTKTPSPTPTRTRTRTRTPTRIPAPSPSPVAPNPLNTTASVTPSGTVPCLPVPMMIILILCILVFNLW